MIIDIAHTKGGVGKTTVAVNLAAQLGADVLDLDLQQSSMRFHTLAEIVATEREKEEVKEQGIRLMPMPRQHYIDGSKLDADELKQLALYQHDKYKHLIVDSGGYDAGEVRYMLSIADMIITPMAPSQVELYGLQVFESHIVKRLLQTIPTIQAYVLLNRVTRYHAEDIKGLRHYVSVQMPEYNVFASTWGQRKAYQDAYAMGLSVAEYQPRSKAAEELRNLTNEISTILALK